MLELSPTLVNKSLLTFSQAHLLCYGIFFGLTRFGWAENVWFQKTKYRHCWRMLYQVKIKKLKMSLW
jgi:hypothetical protein